MTTERWMASNGPWWVRFITQVGVPAAIACGLTFFLTWMVTRDMHELLMNQQLEIRVQENLTGTSRQLIDNQRAIIEVLKDHSLQTAHNGEIQFAMCLNAATGEEARRRCWAFSETKK